VFIEADRGFLRRFCKVQLHIDFAKGTSSLGQLVNEPAAELARLNDKLPARRVINNGNVHTAPGNAIAKFRREKILDFFCRDTAYSGQEGMYQKLGSWLGEQHARLAYRIRRVAFYKLHGPGYAVFACRRQCQGFADCPERQKPYAEFALDIA
jgi:hypothetical protein